MPLELEARAETVSSSMKYKLPAGTQNSSPKYPFGKKSAKPHVDPTLQKKIHKVTSVREKGVALEQPVTFHGRPDSPQKDTDLTPRRTTFPGKSYTLSQMDEETPSQLHMHYAVDENTSAHVAVNEQDISSPTYTPIKRDEGLNAAGMYMNWRVQEHMKVKVGGEVRTHETVSDDAADQSSAGARVGLEWNF